MDFEGPATLSISYTQEYQTPTPFDTVSASYRNAQADYNGPLQTTGVDSTGRGILIGMLSAFGSAALVAIILALVYFFRYTQQGRIFLDRIGRPGEYDDEQAFAKEEAEALDQMDDIQRMEYLRAKGEHHQLYAF